MRSLKKLMILLTLTILGTGCSPEIIAVPDLDWYTPVNFSQETKDWFTRQAPPIYVIKDLNVILKNNNKYKALKESIE